ncbi:MAG: hypothetical protein OSA99_05085 [Acidimicrobiales bacterium]|nr:hypothetical protein [Acidimicrobiales bacterium]
MTTITFTATGCRPRSTMWSSTKRSSLPRRSWRDTAAAPSAVDTPFDEAGFDEAQLAAASFLAR